jgi:sugar (pentulose or hexulose) kinase
VDLIESFFLVMDAGSGGVKCLIVDTSGLIVASGFEEWQREGWNTKIGWSAIRKAVQSTLSKGTDPKNIAGVVTTSMREEFVLLDAGGHEVQYIIEPNAYPHGDRFNETYGQRLYQESGHWPVPGWIAAAKLVWLRDEKPEVLKRTKKILMISDWVGHAFGAEFYTEGSSACETSLFSITNDDWAWNLIDELRLPCEIFPEVKENGTQIGLISKSAAVDTNLDEGTPIFVGGADTQCGLLGSGAVNEGEVIAVCGTTTPVQMVTKKPVIDPRKRAWTNKHVIHDTYVIESNAGRTGWVYRWFRDEINKGSGNDPYEEINTLAASSPPGSRCLKAYLGPHIFSSGPPYWSGDRLGDKPVPPTLIGNTQFSRGDLARAIIEANCYAVKANFDQLREITGISPQRFGMCGGSSKSQLWVETQANVLELPVIVPQERDATAIGAAILAAIGVGFYHDINEAVDNMVHLEDPIVPVGVRSTQYKVLYEEWLATRDRLAGSF